jgi:hypothetical protein
MVTSHRLLHLCQPSSHPSGGGDDYLMTDLPSQLPLACIASISVKGGRGAKQGAPPMLEGTPAHLAILLLSLCLNPAYPQPLTPLSLPSLPLAVTCKNQLTYVYHITPPPLPPSSSRAPPPPTPSSDSLLLSPSALLFPPTPSTSPVDGDVLLARLRVVQEEVLWRNAEDDYAFPHGRCRFVLPSPARLPFFGQPTPRRVSHHSLSTSVHAASWNTEH